MDSVAFGYFATLSIGSGLMFGVLPALRASKVDLTLELKEGARGSVGGRSGRPAAMLVVLQFALTVVLLTVAGLMMRSFFIAQSLNDFVPAEQMFTARIRLPDDASQAYADKDKRVRFYEDFQRRLEALPGVAGAALSSNLPGSGASQGDIEIEGQRAEKAARALHAAYVVVSPTYVSLIGLPMRADVPLRTGTAIQVGRLPSPLANSRLISGPASPRSASASAFSRKTNPDPGSKW